jgi:threonine dehydrogenase-like Zn-dependent dehydrogenase
MTDTAASISSVVANGVRWVKTLGKISFGESLVISGPGSQGLCSLAAALHAGANPVVVLGLDFDTDRLKLAEEFGAHHTVNVDKENPVDAVTRLVPGGPDAVIETSGTPEGIRAAVEMVRPAGRVVTIGLSGGLETPIKFDELVWKSISLISGLGQAGNVSDAMKLIDTGKYPFEKINNRLYCLEELKQAIKDTEERPPGFIKGAIVF